MPDCSESPTLPSAVNQSNPEDPQPPRNTQANPASKAKKPMTEMRIGGFFITQFLPQLGHWSGPVSGVIDAGRPRRTSPGHPLPPSEGAFEFRGRRAAVLHARRWASVMLNGPTPGRLRGL